MPDIVFNDITNWVLLPIDYVYIRFSGQNFKFEKLVDSSFLEINSLVEPNDTGGETIVGYQFVFEFSPVENNLETQLTFMNKCRTAQPTSIDFALSTNYASVQSISVQNFQTAVVIKSWSISWKTRSGTDTDVIYKAVGVFSVDIDTTTPASGTPKLFDELLY